jgi:hypothetical protein
MNPDLVDALEAFHAACDRLKAAGANIIATVSVYEPDTYFSTRVSVEQEDVDHVVLDAIREITKEWSEIAHTE